MAAYAGPHASYGPPPGPPPPGAYPPPGYPPAYGAGPAYSVPPPPGGYPAGAAYAAPPHPYLPQPYPPQPYGAPAPMAPAPHAAVYVGDAMRPGHAEPVPPPAASSAAAAGGVGMAAKPGGGDAGGGEGGGGAYAERMAKAVRLGFIRKVYGILSAQLAVTFGIVCLFVFVDDIREGVRARPGILWAALAVSLACIIALACCNNVAKRVPGNYICLCVFTLAESYLVGAIAASYAPTQVAWAIGTTVLVTLALTAFAWQTKIDFTMMSGSLFVVLIAFIFFGICVSAFRSNVLSLLYATLGVCLFGVFLVYDTQLIIGGKNRAVSYESDDYIFAALNVYMDVIQMFLYLLRLFGGRD